MSEEMSEETRTVPIVVRIPAKLGLTKQDINTLETKWGADIASAAAASGEKIKWVIKLNIEIGNK